MNKEKKNINGIIIASIIFLLIGGVAGYFTGMTVINKNSPEIGNFQNDGFQNGSAQIDGQTKAEIVSFFENTRDSGEINSYCRENPMCCMYYCREVNTDSEFCSQLGENFNREIPGNKDD